MKVFLDHSFLRFGWVIHEEISSKLYIKGYINNRSIQEVLTFFGKTKSQNEIESFLKNSHGHFAFIYHSTHLTIAVTDIVRSIPLYFIKHGQDIHFSAEAQSLVKKFKKQIEFNQDEIKMFLMSGYTHGKSSLVNQLETMESSELFIISPSFIINKKFDEFAPWNFINESEEHLTSTLKQITLKNFERIAKHYQGREIVVPLSGGFDSRLVASALKEVGARNVTCISYGIKDNFDAVTADLIAKKLGFKWKFYPADKVNPFVNKDKTFMENFINFSDSYASAPYIQDLLVLNFLTVNKEVDPNAVFINGNTGDFISGGHIPKGFQNISKENDLKNIFYKSYLKKHCSLWTSLVENNEYTDLIISKLEVIRKEHGVEFNIKNLAPWFEYLEFHNRQSKYVISGQRAYEFFGYNWELPLWSNEFIKFWETTPTSFKFNQQLYKSTLINANWGNVWKDIPINQKNISPKWMVPVRFALKAASSPMGKSHWHNVEQTYLNYFMEPLGLFSEWSYLEIAKDKNGGRHIVSWRTKKYLENKGLSSFLF